MTPFSNVTSPQGPTNLQPAVPSISPDSLTKAWIPAPLASVNDNSTCVLSRTGPKILTPGISFLAPTTVTRSSHAY